MEYIETVPCLSLLYLKVLCTGFKQRMTNSPFNPPSIFKDFYQFNFLTLHTEHVSLLLVIVVWRLSRLKGVARSFEEILLISHADCLITFS